MHRTAILLALLTGLAGGCATTGGDNADESAAELPKGDRSASNEGGASAESEDGSESSAPEGFEDAEVMNVFSTGSGSAVALTADGVDQVVPIFISQSQAMAIKLRLERRRYSRPLTHDLLDNIVEELDGRITKVQIDAIKSGVFVGTVFVESPDGTLELDARSSDAIALAVGNQVPLFVAEGVFEEAGVPEEKFENRGFDQNKERMPSPEREQKKPGEGEGGGEKEGGPYF